MSSESESNEDVPNKRRKGVVRPKTYKRNVIKESSYIGTYGVAADRVRRLSFLPLNNQTSEDKGI